MLQNPSKYHINPLSHFLALHHSTQMMHNTRATPGLTSTHADNSNHYNYHQNQHHHHQQQPQHTQINAYQSPQMSTSPFDSSNSSLDAGKSFTIAAILGLQKSAIENNRKDYNNSVINLSMNCENNDNNKQNNNNNNNNIHKSNRIESINSFDNDKMALMNRFLPAANQHNTNTFNTNQQQHQQQVCANNFVAAAAVAAAAAANASANGHNTPTALQSLQQLHQHHAQQSTLSSFHRDKPKEISKRSSLKNKRVRTIFTPEQLERLEAEFERQQYMVGPERLYLAHTLQLTEAQVKVWFQNRRIKWRKHHLEITHQRLALMRQSQVPTATNPSLESGNACASPVGDESEEAKCIDDIKQLGESRQESESDLSICNESMDNDSAFDCGEDT